MSNGEAGEEEGVGSMQLTQLADSGARRRGIPESVRWSPEIPTAHLLDSTHADITEGAKVSKRTGAGADSNGHALCVAESAASPCSPPVRGRVRMGLWLQRRQPGVGADRCEG